MAFSPDPKVTAAREIAKQFHQTRVIVIMINDDTRTVEYASYGKTKPLCDAARQLADRLFEAVINPAQRIDTPASIPLCRHGKPEDTCYLCTIPLIHPLPD